MAPLTPDPGHELDPQRVKDRLDRGEIVLIDVREQHEWDAQRIPGATHIELGQLASRAGELPRERPIVFMCAVGARSAMATDAFRASGYEAHNLSGGIAAWAERGLPLESRGGPRGRSLTGPGVHNGVRLR
jgi:rhodanese-related sulfurtransferase